MATTLQQWLDQTLAVIVLYKTPLTKSVAFNSLLASLHKHKAAVDWYVYDNSPSYNRDLNPHEFPIFYHPNSSNPGVSRAYNEGHIKAMSLGKKWLILLDQDTAFGLDSIDQYQKGPLTFPGEACFVPQLLDEKGIISPFRFRLGNGIRVKSVTEGEHSLYSLQFVNSGLMISVNAFSQAMGYDEDFPLDFSDYAFIERLKKVHSTFVMLPLTCQHDLSAAAGTSVTESIIRFDLYLTAAKIFKKKYHKNNYWIILRVWLRGLKLCIQFRTVKFLRSLLRSND